MKKLAFLLIVAFPGFASAAACVQDTFINYIALGSTGCTLGPLVVSNFSYSLAYTGPFPPPADSETVTPIASAGIVDGGPLLQFGGAGLYRLRSETVAQTLDITFSYDVTVATPGLKLRYFYGTAFLTSDGATASGSEASACGSFSFPPQPQVCGPSSRIINRISLHTDAIQATQTFDTVSAEIGTNGFGLAPVAAPEPAGFGLMLGGLGFLAAKLR